jgi:hypothetical protein
MSGAGEVTESPSSVIILESKDKDADKPKLDASASDKWTKQASYGKCYDTVLGHRLPGRHWRSWKVSLLTTTDGASESRTPESEGFNTLILDGQRGSYTVLQSRSKSAAPRIGVYGNPPRTTRQHILGLGSQEKTQNPCGTLIDTGATRHRGPVRTPEAAGL